MEVLFKRSLKIREELVADRDGDPDEMALDSLYNLARLMEEQGEYEQAEKLYIEVKSAHSNLHGEISLQVIAQVANIAYMRKKVEDYNEAEDLFLQAIAMEEELMGSAPPLAGGNLISNLSQVANLMARDARYSGAELYCQRVVGLLRGQESKNANDVDYKVLSSALHMLAGVLEEQGKLGEAVKAYEEELRVEQRHVHMGAHPHVASRLGHLGLLKETLGDEHWDDAQKCFQRSIDMWQATTGDDSRVLNNFATFLKNRKQYSEASPLYTRAMKQMKQEQRDETSEEEDQEMVVLLNNLGLCMLRTGEFPSAEPHYRKALELTEHRMGATHPNVAIACNNLGNLCKRMNRNDEAEALYRRALDISMGEDPANPGPNVATAYHNLAKLMEKQMKPRAAIQNYTKCLEVDEACMGKDDPRLISTLTKLAELHDNEGTTELAAEYAKRATALSLRQ